MSNSDAERTTAERITMIISTLILVGILGLAVWANARTGDLPATITVEANLGAVRETDNEYYVPITITNTGGLTAQNVTVTGELNFGEGEPETGEVTIDFLAGGESEQAELIFARDPREGELTVGANSYLKP